MNPPAPSRISFTDADLLATLLSLSDEGLDALPFGVIGFDADGIIRVYNAPEARWAGLEREQVRGTPMFEAVAPCMNNYLVAERFAEARDTGAALDATLDYVLTLRMRPTPCALRLLAGPDSSLQFVLIRRM